MRSLIVCLLLIAGCSEQRVSHISLPGAHSITIIPKGPGPLTKRIVQLDDWHLVPQDSLDVDDAVYAQHLADVEAVQQEQVATLRAMVKRYNVDRIYLEGFTSEDTEALAALLVALKNGEAGKQALLVNLGAAGQLWLDGDIAHVLPAETRAGLDAGRDDPDCDERHQAIVDSMADQEVAIVVLGAAHDLRHQMPPSSEYVRVRTNRVDELMK